MLKKRLKPLIWVNCKNEKKLIIDTYTNLLPELKKLLLTDGLDITIGFSHPSKEWLNIVIILKEEQPPLSFAEEKKKAIRELKR